MPAFDNFTFSWVVVAIVVWLLLRGLGRFFRGGSGRRSNRMPPEHRKLRNTSRSAQLGNLQIAVQNAADQGCVSLTGNVVQGPQDVKVAQRVLGPDYVVSYITPAQGGPGLWLGRARPGAARRR